VRDLRLTADFRKSPQLEAMQSRFEVVLMAWPTNSALLMTRSTRSGPVPAILLSQKRLRSAPALGSGPARIVTGRAGRSSSASVRGAVGSVRNARTHVGYHRDCRFIALQPTVAGEVGEVTCISTVIRARVRSRALRRKRIKVHQLHHVHQSLVRTGRRCWPAPRSRNRSRGRVPRSNRAPP